MDDHPGQGLAWTKIIGWALSLLALGLVVRWLWQLDRSIWSQLGQLRPGLVGMAIVCLLAWFFIRWIAWRVISQHHGARQTPAASLRMWALSEFMRYIPGNVWSLTARWHGSVTAGASRTGSVQSLLIEAFGLIGGALVVILATLHPWWWIYGWLGIFIYVLAGPKMLVGIWSRLKIQDVQKVGWAKLSGLGLLSAGAWLLFGLAHAAIFYSFPDPPVVLIVQLIGFSVLAWLLGYLSIITPMGFGVREFALAGLLRSAGVELSFASLIAVISRLAVILSELIFLGLVLIFSKRQ